MHPKKYLFIINSKSGFTRRGKRLVYLLEKNRDLFRGEVRLVKSEYKGHGCVLGKEAVKNGVDVVIAVGGDGTVNDVASGLVGSDVHFGVIPAGSGNGFARNLGIPLENKKAIQLIQSYSKTTSIDCGEINNRYFFNVAGMGVDGEIARKFDRLNIRGLFSYFVVGVMAMLKYRFPVMELTEESEYKKISPYSLVIANGKQFGGNAIIAPEAVADDGLLDLVIYARRSVWGLVSDAIKLFNGRLAEGKHVTFRRISRIKIDIDENTPVHLDGEPVELGRVLNVRVVPAAIQVIAAKVKPGRYI